MGAEDAADKGERVADDEDGHPGEEAADIVAGAYPLPAEEQDEEGLGKEEDDGGDGGDADAQEEGEAQDVAPQGELLLHGDGGGLVEHLLEGVGQDACGTLGEGEGEGEESEQGFVEIEAQPHEGEVGGEAADQLAGHDVAGKVDVFAGDGTQGCCGGVVVVVFATHDMVQVGVAGHLSQYGAEGQADGVEEVEHGGKQAEEYAGDGASAYGDYLAEGERAVLLVPVAEEDVDAVGAGEVDQQGEEQQQDGGEVGEGDTGQGHDCGHSEEQEGEEGIEPEGQPGEEGGLVVVGGHHDGHLVFAGGEDDEHFGIAEEDVAETEVVGGEQPQQQQVGKKGQSLRHNVAREQRA